MNIDDFQLINNKLIIIKNLVKNNFSQDFFFNINFNFI